MGKPLPYALIAALCLAMPSLAQEGPRPDEGVGAQDYNAAGRGLNESLETLKEAFEGGCQPEALRAVFARDCAGEVRTLLEEERVSIDGVRALRLRRGPVLGRDLEAASEAWAARRATFTALDDVAFKLLLVDRVESTGRVHARFRTEFVGRDAEGRSRVERASWRGVWTKGKDGYRLESFDLTEGEVVLGPGDLFRECAEEKGLQSFGVEDPRFRPPSDSLRYQVIRHAIGGAAAGDVNGDGWDDVLLTTGDSIFLFMNDAGAFRHATAEAGLSGVKHVNAPLFADFDNDGDQDLTLGRFYGQNLLFENTGGGRFVDRTEGSGFAQDDMTAVLAAGDFNGDGHLDLYLGRFLDARTEVPDMILYTRNGSLASRRTTCDCPLPRAP